MKKYTSILTLVTLLLILIFAGVFTYFINKNVRLSERDSEASATLIVTDDSPYTDMDGEPFTFDQFRGKVRVVNSWATWCPFCTKELADFQLLASEYVDQDVVVIAINRKESKERAANFLNSVGALPDIYFAIDLTDAYYKSIGGFSMPETVFYDKEGAIVVHKRGFMNLDEMRSNTEKALRNNTNQ